MPKTSARRTPADLGRLALVTAALSFPALAHAAPYRPTSDQQVLEKLPARVDSAQQRELRALREALAADPRNLDKALALAQRYYQRSRRRGRSALHRLCPGGAGAMVGCCRSATRGARDARRAAPVQPRFRCRAGRPAGRRAGAARQRAGLGLADRDRAGAHRSGSGAARVRAPAGAGAAADRARLRGADRRADRRIGARGRRSAHGLDPLPASRRRAATVGADAAGRSAAATGRGGRGRGHLSHARSNSA